MIKFLRTILILSNLYKNVNEYLKKKIPFGSKYYDLDLNKNFHIFKNQKKSYYKKTLLKLSFNELCILFQTDKATLFEAVIYDIYLKRYVRSLVNGHGYSQYYSMIDKNKVKNLVEIGSYEGASAMVFSAYFQKAKIFCLDLTFKYNKLKYKNSIKVEIDQLNKEDLKKFIIKNKLKNKIDLISDDGAHKNEHIINSFKVLFPNLKKGGYYFIEDVSIKKTKKVYDLFKSNRYKKIADIKFFKSNLNKFTLSAQIQPYLIVIKKKDKINATIIN